MVSGRPLRAERPFPERLTPEDAFPEIDGNSASIRALKRDMLCVARDPDVTILLRGESGTGKERVAHAIHRTSSRSAAPFVVVDCAGLPVSLAEDALFGHVRGAFTGAAGERASPFERADGGTVLLDEIGDLPLELQMKLLRAIQSRTIQRLGGWQDTRFDVRLIAATHVDLAAAVAARRFREDLFYRLNVYEIVVPPLGRRGAGDIVALAMSILGTLAERRRRRAPELDLAVVDRLTAYPWPGNVRELENALERMLVASAGAPVLRMDHLPGALRHGPSALPPVPRVPLPAPEAIRDGLRLHDFRYGRTAAALGLSRHQLYRLVKRHALGRPANP